MFETSWRLLSQTELRALARCSVFQGGFTVEAAGWVVGQQGQAAVVLAALVAKSLLHWDDAAHRYAMHDVVRQFAGERVVDLAEQDSHNRHSDYYLTYVEQHEASLRGATRNRPGPSATRWGMPMTRS